VGVNDIILIQIDSRRAALNVKKLKCFIYKL
jgi:hypothetical protein